MADDDAPKLLKIRVADHAKCAADIGTVGVEWLSPYYFLVRSDLKSKLADHLKFGALVEEK
jgi:hypothetical protein